MEKCNPVPNLTCGACLVESPRINFDEELQTDLFRTIYSCIISKCSQGILDAEEKAFAPSQLFSFFVGSTTNSDEETQKQICAAVDIIVRYYKSEKRSLTQTTAYEDKKELFAKVLADSKKIGFGLIAPAPEESPKSIVTRYNSY